MRMVRAKIVTGKAALPLRALGMVALMSASAAAQLPTTHRRVFEALATPIASTAAEAERLRSDGACMLRMELAWQRLRAMSCAGTSVEELARKAEARLRACHRTMERIRELDGNAPDYSGLVVPLIDASPALWKAANDKSLKPEDLDSLEGLLTYVLEETWNSIWNWWSLSEERTTYRKQYRAVRALGLPADVMRWIPASNGRRRVPGALSVDVDGSWCGQFPFDRLTLRNDTGKVLTNCVVRVYFDGYHGADAHKANAKRFSEAHLHFVPTWKPGERRIAHYASSAADGIASNESVDIISEVQVSLVSDQVRGITDYRYLGKNFDHDVERYFEKQVRAKFRGGWSPFVAGVVFDDDATIRLNYENKGMARFPLRGATAILKKRGRELGRYKLRVGCGYLESGSVLGGASWNMSNLNHLGPNAVDELKMILRFPRSDYTYQVRWTY